VFFFKQKILIFFFKDSGVNIFINSVKSWLMPKSLQFFS
jgi:hypothetical protein